MSRTIFAETDYSVLAKFITVVDGVLSPETCDKILAEYSSDKAWQAAQVGNNQVSKKVRNVDVVGISAPDVILQNYDVRTQIDQEVFKAASKCLNSYNEMFPWATAESDTGYDLLRYAKDQFYVEHVDSFKAIPRAISCSFALNEDYDGGEFAFFERRLKIKAKKGSALMFPSNFMYPHEVMPVTSGTRYSIITWFI